MKAIRKLSKTNLPSIDKLKAVEKYKWDSDKAF